MPRKEAKAILARFPQETDDIIVDAIGRVRIVRLKHAKGSRLIVQMDLEDDTLLKAKDVADKRGNSKRPLP